MFTPKLLHSITPTGDRCCSHISCVKSDMVWVSDKYNLVLMNKTGDTLHRVEDFNMNFPGAVHTVNCEDELIYIRLNEEYMDIVTELSNDMKTKTDFIVNKDSTWMIRCVYWSLSTEDLLVGMTTWSYRTSKVVRYNQAGQLTQTI